MPRAVKKILIVRTDRFGEFLLIIPAVRALKEKFPDARICAVVHPGVVGIAGCIPLIDRVCPWDPQRHSWIERMRYISTLKNAAYDLALIFNPSKEFHLFSFLAGIPLRVGYNRKCGYLLNRRMEDEKHLARKHEIGYNLDLVRLVGADTSDKSLSLCLDDSRLEFEPAGALAVAVHPFTSDPVKQWPLGNFKQLISALQRELNAQVILVGGAQEERAHASFLREAAGGENIVNLVGKTSLPELAGVLKRCRLLISGDSGPVHLAGCVNTPVVALFRSDLAGKQYTRWGPVSAGSEVLQAADLALIAVSSVLEAGRKVLRL